MTRKYFADLVQGNNFGINVKCRCESKSAAKKFMKKARDGQSSTESFVTNFSFFDGATLMNAACFDSEVVNEIEEGKSYELQNLYVSFNSFIRGNQITLNSKTGIKICEENLEGKYSDIANSIEHAVNDESCKAVAGICVNLIEYKNVKKLILTDFSGSIEVTMFDNNLDIQIGSTVIIQNFRREMYRGGHIFIIADDTKLILDDNSYECFNVLQEWFAKNEFQMSDGPYFSAHKESEETVDLKRKSKEIIRQIDQDMEDLSREMEDTEIYLERLRIKKLRLTYERKIYSDME